MSLAGALPRDCGIVDLAPSEMLFWMYCPISVPGESKFFLPENLKHFAEIITKVREEEPDRFSGEYVYLTAKTLWVEGKYIGNRPGWHIDGYGTDDLNFIWSDRAPTEFQQIIGGRMLSDDCDRSMRQMEHPAEYEIHHRGTVKFVTFPDKTLLRLDNMVIHRSPAKFQPGLRTFVKVSISPDRYNLKGNSVNHRLPETRWPLVERQATRNHPAPERH